MSALPIQTYISPLNPAYVPFTSNGLTNASGQVGTSYISTMTSDHIVLDGQNIDCTSAGGGTLLINGVALTSVNQNVSTVQNWAQYPALSSITYTTSGGTGGAINLGSAVFSTLTTVQTAALSTITVSGTAGVTGLLTTANHTNTGLLSTLGCQVSTLNGQRVNFYDGANVLSGSFAAIDGSVNQVSVSGLADGLYMFYAAGDTTVGKEFVFPFQVYGGTAYAGSTVFNFGPSYVFNTDYGSQNSMSSKGNAIAGSKTIGIAYKSTKNPAETINYYIELVGTAYKN